MSAKHCDSCEKLIAEGLFLSVEGKVYCFCSEACKKQWLERHTKKRG